MTDTADPFDRVIMPQFWAEPPCYLSYSVVKEIEKCPLQWSLKRSRFPDIWDRSGYPRRITSALLVGNIVHNILEYLIKEFVSKGCTSITEQHELLSSLGGFDSLIKDYIEKELESEH